MDIISYLEERGLVEDKTSEEIKKVFSTPRSLYLGIDPTASSLHLGNLLGLVVLKAFQKFGHRPVVVIGGTTAKIGDPSGKDKERPLLTDEQVQDNIKGITKTIEFCLDFSDEEVKPIIVNNASWYDSMSMVSFLRDIGKNFRLGTMLAKESVKTRVNSEEGMSYTEFSYQLLQGYDFYHLNKTADIVLQVGGSDQYGNIIAGIDCTRKISQKSVYGLVFPLLKRSDGKKFGKTEKGAISLDKEILSPYQFYQHILQFPDSDMISMLKKLTFMPLEEINSLEKEFNAGDLAPFTLQKILANTLCEYVHGEDGLEEAKKATKAMSIGSDTFDKDALKHVKQSLPLVEIDKQEIVGVLYLDLLCKSGLLKSKGEARRLVKNNGAYLNKVKVDNPSKIVEEEDLIDGDFLLLSSGKKTSLIVQVK